MDSYLQIYHLRISHKQGWDSFKEPLPATIGLSYIAERVCHLNMLFHIFPFSERVFEALCAFAQVANPSLEELTRQRQEVFGVI